MSERKEKDMDNLEDIPSGIEPQRVVREENEKKDKKIQDELDQVTVRKKNASQPGSGLFSRLLITVYRVLYIIGSMVIRRWRSFRRKMHLSISKIRGGAHSFFENLFRVLRHAFTEFLRRIKQPFVRFKSEWRRRLTELKEAKTAKQSVAEIRSQLILLSLEMIWRIVRTLLNHTLPILAAVFLYFVITNTMATDIGLHVVYKGEDIGYIKNENEFAKALEDVEGRIVSGLESSYTSGVPSFEVVEIKHDEQFTPTYEIANNIIRASSEEIQPAYAVYVSDELLGAVEDGDKVYVELQNILEKNKTGRLDERVEFQKNVSYTDGLFPKESIMEADELIAKIHSDEIEQELYTVGEGDTVSTISDKLGIAQSTLKRLNPELAEDETSMRPGDELYVTKAKPLLSVQNVYTEVYIEEVDYKVVETPDPLYAEGYRKIISEGVPGTGQITAEITAVDGIEINRDILEVVHLTDPIDEKVTVGTDEGGDGSSGFMWPGHGGYISCYVGGYPGHAGIDIAGTGGVGSPVYASASGTVVKASWGYVGYGNHIVIDHGGGWQTLYAHNSDMYVQVGDYVQKGKIIAAVGATGWATGPHIHFEVIQSGQKLNPVHYVGDR